MGRAGNFRPSPALKTTFMNGFDEIARNYNIAATEFTLVVSGAEALALISLIQLGFSTSDPGKFEKVFGETIPIAQTLIDDIAKIDSESGAQLNSGWGLRGYSKTKEN